MRTPFFEVWLKPNAENEQLILNYFPLAAQFNVQCALTWKKWRNNLHGLVFHWLAIFVYCIHGNICAFDAIVKCAVRYLAAECARYTHSFPAVGWALLIKIDCEVIALFDDITFHVCIDGCISIFIAFTIRCLSFAHTERKRTTQIFMVGNPKVLTKIK